MLFRKLGNFIVLGFYMFLSKVQSWFFAKMLQSLLRKVPNFSAFRSLKSCLGLFQMNFATFQRKTKIDVLLCLIYIFKSRFQNKNRTTSAASRHFTINALNKLVLIARKRIISKCPFFYTFEEHKVCYFSTKRQPKKLKIN